MTYQYHDLDCWAGVFQRRCRDRFNAFGHRGRCELKRDHSGDDAAERGMIWVRWNDDLEIWLTMPGSADQGRIPA